ncbi:MAG: hypothetical protein AB2L14_37460 [Candidatus Xenobiia bacterium LiM19]
MTDVSESHSTVPHRGQLLRELRTLQKLSLVIKDLTSQEVESEEDLKNFNSNLAQCFADQSRIVHIFYSLSEDEQARNALVSAIGSIDNAMSRLSSALSSEEVRAVNEELSGHIDRWVDVLQSMIKDVIEKAPPPPEGYSETADDVNA